jgi:signal transduction histidine kinase
MGTRSEGLWRWRDGRVDKLGPSEGYPVRSVHAILDDGLGFLWMPSQRGIVRAARADLHATADGRARHLDAILIDRQDGLPSVEGSSSQPSCLRDSRGDLWFANQRGIALVHPGEVRPNPVPPPVQIFFLEYHPAMGNAAEVRANLPGLGTTSKAVQYQAPFPKTLELPPGCYGIEITYAAPSFSAPEQLRFQTRLEGLSQQWEDISNRRVSRFEQLPPGDYSFHVRAANNDGIWNEAGDSVAFTILPYYWQTRTFRAAVGLLLAATGAGVVWWRTRTRRRSILAEMDRMQREMAERKRTEEVLSRQRNELAHMSRVTVLGELSGSLAHELNQPLTSILSNAQAAQRYLAQANPDLDELREILSDIVNEDQRAGEIIRRLRGLLKKGEEQHHELDPNLIVQEVLRLVRNDLLNQGITAEVQLTPNSPQVLGDRVQLQQVLLNLILNACEAMSALPKSGRFP